MATTTTRFNDTAYKRSSLAEGILPRHLHAPFWRRVCVRPQPSIDGRKGRVWTHGVNRFRTLCDSCAWLRPSSDFHAYRRTPVHWLVEEGRAVDLTRCVCCRGRHLQWTTNSNCTGCIRAILDASPRHLPAFPIIEAPRPLEPPQERDVPWIVPAGAE